MSLQNATTTEIREIDVLRALDAHTKARLERGEHPLVARELRAREEFVHAAWVLEQIWDFDAAGDTYLEARRYVDALRCALASRNPDTLARMMHNLETDPALEAGELQSIANWLQGRRRATEAASLLSMLRSDTQQLANVLVESGEHFGACEALLRAGEPAAALERIEERDPEERSGRYDALAAEATWQLGDAESSAEHAQRALGKGLRDRQLLETLARSLVSLGYPIAAESVVDEPLSEADRAGTGIGPYRATGVLTASFAGVAYSALDRRHLQDVEVHLLLGDRSDASSEHRATLEAFANRALAADAIGHPAIRKIIRLDTHSGLLVLPRAQGPQLSSLIRAPGLLHAPARVIALILRIGEGLLAAQGRGIIHGSLLPSQIVCDAAGRPLIGPFGANELFGLVATRTGTLDELLGCTAPELRGGASPTAQGDIFALGVLFYALWHGRLPERNAFDTAGLPDAIALALDPDPAQRPELRHLLAELRAIRFDAGRLATDALRRGKVPSAWAQDRPAEPSSGHARAGIPITSHESWSDGLIDELCAQSPAQCQSILDREGRQLWLAPWPVGASRLPHGCAWETVIPEAFWSALAEPLAQELHARARAEHWVRVPSGEWLLALDELLRCAPRSAVTSTD